MEESLILLKHELCLDWSDILVFKGSVINSKTYDTANFKLLDTQELFLNEVLLDTDIMLYKQALVKFEETILKYGTKKMLDELKKFRKFSSEPSKLIEVCFEAELKKKLFAANPPAKPFRLC